MANRNILVVYFSQTGRVKAGLEDYLKKYREAGDEIEIHAIKAIEKLPFPWGFFKFFSIMPETVLGPSMEIKPLAISTDKTWDLVVLGFPVWFLSVAPPMKSFLLGQGKTLLKGMTVQPFISCRELWISGYNDFVEIADKIGFATYIPLVIKEPLASWKTYLSTPIYLMTGKKIYKDNALSWRDAHSTASNRFIERVGKASFLFWATLLKRVSPPKTVRRSIAICFFFLYLLLAIPLLKVIGALVSEHEPVTAGT